MRARAILRQVLAFVLRRPKPAPRPSAFTRYWRARGIDVQDVSAAELKADLEARLRGRDDELRVPWVHRSNRRLF